MGGEGKGGTGGGRGESATCKYLSRGKEGRFRGRFFEGVLRV